MIINVQLDKVKANPWNTRQGDPAPEYIQELANDIAANGLLQAPAGRLINSDGSLTALFQPFNQARIDDLLNIGERTVQLAFGHNRLAAFRLLAEQDAGKDEKAGYDLIPIDVQPFSDEQMALLAWSENEKRRDVTPIERARAIQRRIDDFGWSQKEVADKLGVSRPAVSNALRLLKLPENVQAGLSRGDIPERTAMALVSLFDLPESIRKSAEGYWPRFSDMVREALKGGKTSDEIRQYYKQLINGHGRDLVKASFSLDDMFTIEGVRSPTCRDCDQRLKENNICLDLDCYSLKSNVDKIEYLRQASWVCGIPPIEELNTSSYDITNFSNWSERAKHLSNILEANCPNLRLIYQDGTNDEDKDRIEDFPYAAIVCSKKEQFCTCLKGLRHAAELATIVPAKEADYSAEDLKDLAKEARREKREAQSEAKTILQDAAERIAAGLALKNKDTWRRLLASIDYMGQSKEYPDLWEIQVAIGMKLAGAGMPYQIESVKQVVKGLNGVLTECGLELIDVPGILPTSGYTDPEPEPVGKTLAEVFEVAE